MFLAQSAFQVLKLKLNTVQTKLKTGGLWRTSSVVFLGALDHGSLRRAEPGTVWDAPVGPFGEGTKDMALARLFSDLGVDVTSPGCCTGVEIGTGPLGAQCTSRFWRTVHGWPFALFDLAYQFPAANLTRAELTAENAASWFAEVFPVGFPSLHVVVANSLRRRLIPPYFAHAPRGALRRCTSEIVAVQKFSNPQAYGRSVLGYIEADFVSTKEKH